MKISFPPRGSDQSILLAIDLISRSNLQLEKFLNGSFIYNFSFNSVVEVQYWLVVTEP